MDRDCYIAPETWRGNSAALDGRADWFALGVIVFRWLTGELPFSAPDLLAKMAAVTSGPRPSAVALRAELPATVDAWLARALAVEPDDRFQTGAEFHDALAAALRGEAWPQTGADVSGVRSVAGPALVQESPEKKSTLSVAWGAAAALLKRFTGPRERAGSAPPTANAPLPPSAPPPADARPAPAPVDEPLGEAAAGDRKSIWLDSSELEDLGSAESQRAPASLPASTSVPAPTPSAPPSPGSQTGTQSKISAKAKRRAARARKPARTGVSKTKRARPKKRKP